jgi:hypothetical protein
MKASLEDFARTGVFGSIELDMTRSQVEQLLGLPDDWEYEAPTYQSATIWKYGDIEFYFQADRLYMIFTDDFKIPKGGTKIQLDAWIVDGNLTCSEAKKSLSASNIPYVEGDAPHNENGKHLITGAGVTFAFCGEDKPKINLRAIYRKENPR